MKELHKIRDLILFSTFFEHGSQTMDRKVLQKVATSARNNFLTQYFDHLELKQFEEESELFL